ncbi:MAG: asparaginase [Candidatus Aenigmarchaeota archaeon]|nr:asparaginase [Candidatus Aenigmarchaeota archaeon]
MDTVALITTGGTIASEDRGQGLTPAKEGEELIRKLQLDLYGIDNVEVHNLMNRDSSNLNWKDRLTIGQEAAKFLKRDDVRGAVITHGTDTAIITGYVMEFGLKYPTKPLVITGSQLPFHQIGSDGPRNLRDSFITAYRGDFADVLFCVQGHAFKIENLREIRGYDLDGAFEPDRRQGIAKIHDSGEIEYNTRDLYLRRGRRSIGPTMMIRGDRDNGISNITKILESREIETAQTAIERDSKHVNTFDACFDHNGIILVDALNPPHPYRRMVEEGEIRGVVIDGWGAGHVCMEGEDSWESFLGACQKKDIPVVMCTKFSGSVSNVYEVGRRVRSFGVIPSGDWISEGAQVRMAYINGHRDLIEGKMREYRLRRTDLWRRLWMQMYVGGIIFKSPSEEKQFIDEEKVFTQIDLCSPSFLFRNSLELATRYLLSSDRSYA